MATTGKGLLEPKSPINPEFGRIKKVFIAYVHNPDEYEAYVPPYRPEELLDSNILNFVFREKQRHENQQRNKIEKHTKAIQSLATYLSTLGVPVVYDEYWRGKHVSNQLQQFEEQIMDTDYVLLVITPSTNHYLLNVAPIDEEIMFTDNFLFNLMTVKKPPGTNFIPIFVNSTKNRDLVPTHLASSMIYELIEPFDYQRGDMYDLYKLVTNQKTEPLTPTVGVVRVPRRNGAFSIPVNQSSNNQNHYELYKTLWNRNEPLSFTNLQHLSSYLSSQWQAIAIGLRLTEREIHDCLMKAGISRNTREACYQMLYFWQNRDPLQATTASLAHGLWNANCGELLKHLI